MKKFIFVFLFICTGANSAQLVGSEITLCTNGFSPDGSTCTTYGAGDCASGYYDLTPTSTSFVSTMNGTCSASGYKSRTLPDTTITMMYHGAVVGSEIALCTNGYSPDGSTCTTYGTTNCPSDYYNVNVGATSFAENNGSCASGYKQYEADASCGFEPEGKTCVNFCGDGELVTGVGGCSALCSAGSTTLRTSTGLKYPLWATKQTTPSLNLKFPNGGRCYVNLTDEPTDSQSIWVKWENNRLHATK